MNKKIIVSISLIFLFLVLLTGCDDSIFSGQVNVKKTGSVNGIVKERSTKEVLSGVDISVGNKIDSTNSNGSFLIKDLEVGNYKLIVNFNKYKTKELDIVVNEGSNNLGDILIEREKIYEEIKFEDKNLENKVREAINKETGAITKEDVSNLYKLNAEDSEIISLKGIDELVNLKYLSLRSYRQDGRDNDNQISDISYLKSLENLEELEIDYNNISDISPLENLKNLKKLSIGANDIKDYSPIKELTNLYYIQLFSNNIEDISFLSNLENLTNLNLHGNSITDITPLAKLKNLTNLQLSYNQLKDISPISNLSSLTKLTLYNNEITKINVLLELPNLEYVNLNDNPNLDVSEGSEAMKVIEELRNRGCTVEY